MTTLAEDIRSSAEKAAKAFERRSGGNLDYTEASLKLIEEMLEEAADFTPDMSPEIIQNLVENFGCYILEVGRNEFGGAYRWHEGRDQPVLVVGEPGFHVAMITWDKVRGRLNGDEADNIPFFYAGFAKRAREAEPGSHVLYV